ncbi:DUF2057 domain-containing protein [uncultured Ferrimonas sp.]|uniref:YccT family protein n=1 Tax=uncultured Ferrimonas sp. TaxID=432640 RepID=UPI00262C5914|nr:DUF2057 domain-containing protein [uncultured Ferrimonas sp.]
MKKALATAMLVISPITLAGTLTIPQEFEFIAINGKSVSSSLFSHNDEEALIDGNNKIALQYKDLIREEIGDGHVKVKSAPFVISFHASDDIDYRLKTAIEIADQEQAEAFAKQPQLHVTTSQGAAVEFTLEMSDSHERGIFNQLMGQYPNAEASSVAATGGAAAAATQAPAAQMAQATAPVVVAPAPTVANQPHSMLQYWWQEADSATRNAFTGWAVQHLVSQDAPQQSNSDNQTQNMLHYWFIKADQQTRKTFMSWAIQNL